MNFSPISSGRLAYAGVPTRWLTRFLGADGQKILGCNLLEIAKIEEAMGATLPLAYKQWMSEAGRSLGLEAITSEFRRSYMTYPEVLELRTEILELLDEIGANRRLLDKNIPFYNWEFDTVLLLDLANSYDHPNSKNVDCPVLQLNQFLRKTSWCSPSFSEFIGWKILLLADKTN